MNGAAVQYAIVQTTNEIDLSRLIDWHTCVICLQYKRLNWLTLIIHWILNNWKKILNSEIIYIGPISARYRKPTSIFRHRADIGPIWECLLGESPQTVHHVGYVYFMLQVYHLINQRCAFIIEASLDNICGKKYITYFPLYKQHSYVL